MIYLGLLDVSGVQEYLFRDPELKQIAEKSNKIENFGRDNGLFVRTAGDHGVKVVVSAGGNASYLSDDRDKLACLFRRISHKLLMEGDGLQIVVTILQCDNNQSFATNYRKALRQLEREKLTQPRSAECAYSGLSKPTVVSSSKSSSTNNENSASDIFIEPKDLDKLVCKSGEQSTLVAVVSVDGLGMGKRLIRWMTRMEEEDVSQEEFCRRYAKWSEDIKSRWKQAWDNSLLELQRVFEKTINNEEELRVLAHPHDKHDKNKPRTISLQRVKHQNHYCCRRIYQGGDDMSFVCDARVAFSFAKVLMNLLETLPAAEGVDEEFKTLSVSAGIVFVSSHFPFVRSVKMSEDVRKVAKKKSTEIGGDNLPSVLDWWINRQGAMERTKSDISMKPYLLHDNSNQSSEISWDKIDNAIMPAMWAAFDGQRNKLKDIIAAAEDGPEYIKKILNIRPLEKNEEDENGNKKKISRLEFLPEQSQESGFNFGGKKTLLTDLGEIYDIHFPFPKQGEKE